MRRFVLWGALVLRSCAGLGPAHATGADTATVPPADPAACTAAIAANDDDKIVGACGVLIDNEKTAKPDRLKALMRNGMAYVNVHTAAHKDGEIRGQIVKR